MAEKTLGCLKNLPTNVKCTPSRFTRQLLLTRLKGAVKLPAKHRKRAACLMLPMRIVRTGPAAEIGRHARGNGYGHVWRLAEINKRRLSHDY
jgi:hypothetical protein